MFTAQHERSFTVVSGGLESVKKLEKLPQQRSFPLAESRYLFVKLSECSPTILLTETTSLRFKMKVRQQPSTEIIRYSFNILSYRRVTLRLKRISNI